MSRSNNSGGKSLNSNNSNEQNKKRKTNQKTIGVAWGANSISSSKSASRNSPFSDFGSYMVEKNRKLRNQFDVDASGTSLGDSGKPLFHGVAIFVDGFTVPSSQELRSYMLKYGGRLENYFSRHRVTHIICSNLPDSKLKNIRSFSGGLPVVKPMWIVDSVAANKLLNWVPYQLDQLVELSRQPKLSAFFPLKSNTSSEGAVTPSNHHVKLETARCLSDGLDTSKDKSSSEAGDFVEDTAECSGESVSSGHGTPFDVIREVENSIDFEENCSEGRATEPCPTDVGDEAKGKKTLESSPLKSSVSGGSYCSDKQTLKGSEQNIAGTGNPRHSTLGDPNFVKNYFKYSRLHFIGTWRNRYRKRFPSAPGCSIVSAPKVSQKVVIIHVVHFRRLEKPNEDCSSIGMSGMLTYEDVTKRIASHLGLDDPRIIRLTLQNPHFRHPKSKPIRDKSVAIFYNEVVDTSGKPIFYMLYRGVDAASTSF